MTAPTTTAAQLGDPALDPPLTVRVHPDDNPLDPAARRVVKSSDPWAMPWYSVTGPAGVIFEDYRNDQVASWPISAPTEYGRAFVPQAYCRFCLARHDTPEPSCPHCGAVR